MKIESLKFNMDYDAPAHHKAEPFREAKTPKKEKPPPEQKAAQMESLVKLEEALSQHKIALRFSRDGATKQLVVSVVDENTGEAIRQIPSEVSLKLAAQHVKLQGQFVDKIE